MIRPAFTEVGIFLIPFAVYALFLIATRSGLLVQSSWPVSVISRLLVGALLHAYNKTAGNTKAAALKIPRTVSLEKP